MKIYENVVIGTFLYLLGLCSGRRLQNGGPIARAVNLLQQTPLDQSIADVLIQSPGSLYVLEFKRDGSSEDKERTKRTALERCLTDHPRLRQLSEEIHWYAKSAVNDDGQLRVQVSPYLHFGVQPRDLSLEDLVTEIVASGEAPFASMRECFQYLGIMRAALAIGEASSGTIVIVASSDAGIQHVVVDDLRDFFKVHAELVNAARQISASPNLPDEAPSHNELPETNSHAEPAENKF